MSLESREAVTRTKEELNKVITEKKESENIINNLTKEKSEQNSALALLAANEKLKHGQNEKAKLEINVLLDRLKK